MELSNLRIHKTLFHWPRDPKPIYHGMMVKYSLYVLCPLRSHQSLCCAKIMSVYGHIDTDTFCYQSPSSNTKRCRTTVFNNLPITMYNLRNEDWLKISSKDWKIETPWCFFSLLILPKHFTARKCIFFLQYNRLLPTTHFCQQNTNNFDFNLDFWSGDQSGN